MYMRTKHSILRIDPELRAQIDAAAKFDGVGFSEWVREACRERLERKPVKPRQKRKAA